MRRIVFLYTLLAVLSCAPKERQVRLLVGTYTENTTSVGVYLYSFDTETADCTLCACRDSNCIEIYSIDTATGALTLTDKSIEVGAPVCVQFLSEP